jgi:hypothetical protein
MLPRFQSGTLVHSMARWGTADINLTGALRGSLLKFMGHYLEILCRERVETMGDAPSESS